MDIPYNKNLSKLFVLTRHLKQILKKGKTPNYLPPLILRFSRAAFSIETTVKM